MWLQVLGGHHIMIKAPSIRLSGIYAKFNCYVDCMIVLLLINVCVIGSTRCHLLKKQKQHLGRTGNWHLASRP